MKEDNKYILTPCKFCKIHFGVEEAKYHTGNKFSVNCPYCKKKQEKGSLGRFLDLVRSL
jgi:PHP family Zn ribbon phosphoesterase